MDGIIFDEAKKLLERRTADQIQVFGCIRLRVERGDRLRVVSCDYRFRDDHRFLPDRR